MNLKIARRLKAQVDKSQLEPFKKEDERLLITFGQKAFVLTKINTRRLLSLHDVGHFIVHRLGVLAADSILLALTFRLVE